MVALAVATPALAEVAAIEVVHSDWQTKRTASILCFVVLEVEQKNIASSAIRSFGPITNCAIAMLFKTSAQLKPAKWVDVLNLGYSTAHISARPVSRSCDPSLWTDDIAEGER